MQPVPEADQIFYRNAQYWLEHRQDSLTVRHGKLKKIAQFNLWGRLVKWHKNHYHHHSIDLKVENVMRDTVDYFKAPGRHDLTATLKHYGSRLDFIFTPENFVKEAVSSNKFNLQ